MFEKIEGAIKNGRSRDTKGK